MSPPAPIRAFQPGDLPLLWRVFHASVHGLTGAHYTRAQQVAWAPDHGFTPEWAARVSANRPWVAEQGGRIVGFADLQADGLIDMCFVAPEAARTGVGSALMACLADRATRAGLDAMHAQVSLSAEAFFRRQGFARLASHARMLRGQSLRYSEMRRPLP